MLSEVDQNTSCDSGIRNVETVDKEEGDSGIDANSQGSCSSNDVKSKEKRKDKKKKKSNSANNNNSVSNNIRDSRNNSNSSSNNKNQNITETKEIISQPEKRSSEKPDNSTNSKNSRLTHQLLRKPLVFESSRHPADREDFESTGNESYVSNTKGKKQQ